MVSITAEGREHDIGGYVRDAKKAVGFIALAVISAIYVLVKQWRLKRGGRSKSVRAPDCPNR